MQTMHSSLQKSPYKYNYYAKKLARVHFEMHKNQSSLLPTLFKSRMIKISDEPSLTALQKKDIFDYFKILKQGDNDCHGDCHLKSITFQDDNWIPMKSKRPYQGNPLSDVANTYLELKSPCNTFEGNGFNSLLLKIAKARMPYLYLKRYLNLSGNDITAVKAWLLPAAAIRLTNSNADEHDWLLKLIEKELKQFNAK